MTDDAPSSSRPLPDLIGGRYRIVSRLGVGGMGVVYKAIDIQLNRAVAVKALEDRRLLMPGASSRLRTEALAAASIDHPYICKVYELLESAGETFIVMEFVEGETLASMMKRGVLPLPQTLQVAREIAEGLANAHQRGLVHRDVKPSNVMVTTSGHVKLLDFGVSSVDVASTPGDRTRTVTPQITVHAGTPQYMAPEVAAGQPVTSRADLFSLGVMLYELLAGALPFSGTTTFDYVRNMMQSPPRRLDRVAPDTPADLVDLVERCLEKMPGARPESADVVVAELRRLSAAISSPQASVRSARQARAGRRWQVIAGAAIAIAALALGWRLFWPRGSGNAPPRQLRPFVTSAALEFDSRISPDGQWVSFISTSGGTSRIMVQRVDGGEARPITLGEGTPVSQIWSADGTQLVCVLRANNDNTDWLLQVYPAFFGGAPQQTVSLDERREPNTPSLQGIDLLRQVGDAIYLLVRDTNSVSLRRIGLDPSARLVNASAAWKLDGRLRSVDISPDGRTAAIVQAVAGQEDLWVINVDGTGARAVTHDAFFERDPLWNGRGDRIIFQSNRGGQMDLWEIDPRSQAATQLTSGEAEKTAESTSADGSLISFQWLSQDAKLWVWGSADPAGQQLTQDALSDYSPVVAGNGRTIAFQRSLPISSRGATIVDAKVLAAPFDGRALTSDLRPIANGFAPSLSPSGAWLGYLEPGAPAAKATLQVRNLLSGATVLVSRTAAIPLSFDHPVEWASGTMAWTGSGDELFFVDQPDASTIRRYKAGEPVAGPPLARSNAATEFLRDVYVSPDDRRLAYVSASREAFVVHAIDLTTTTDRVLLTLPGAITSAFGRGWIDDGFVVVRRTTLQGDFTGDIEVTIVNAASGAVTLAGVITNGFITTTRLHASRRVLYVTRIENGVHNLYEFSLATGVTKALTKNVLPGVTFSGFHPFGADAMVGVREERRQDIWLIQESGTKRPGNQAGR